MSNDVLYCAEQIKIPPTFPNILKLYAKAAIRTQPYDLLRWTCAYFRALAADELPPVKVETLVLSPISSLFTRTSQETEFLFPTFFSAQNKKLHCSPVGSFRRISAQSDVFRTIFKVSRYVYKLG
ncbi:ropporin-1-like protein [Lasioglossum baleicum]|uniref:ropporin-1-like protein n=1 Tax=Lasioglossum baleicum TaxID=434251 RepID=UPI003FCE6A29